MSRAPKTRAPAGLEAAGKRVWRETLRAVADGWQLDERDLLLLEHAGRHADLIADLEAAIKADGITVKGAAGQDRLSAGVPALNVARGVLARLLAQIEIAPPGPKTGALNGRQRAELRMIAAKAEQHG